MRNVMNMDAYTFYDYYSKNSLGNQRSLHPGLKIETQ